MQTLILNGSPRKGGDTDAMIEAFVRELGGHVEVLRAGDLKVAPCTDCRFCRSHAGCSQHDGMQEILEKIRQADCVVVASPVFFTGLTGPLISLLSRLQTLYAARRFRGEAGMPGQRLGAVLLAAGGEGEIRPAERAARMALSLMGAGWMGTAVAPGTDACPAAQDEEALLSAAELARNVCDMLGAPRALAVSAGAIEDGEGRVLLCQRGYGERAGLWEFPGGKREPGESAAQCLMREIEEELGLAVKCTQELGRLRQEYPDRTVELTFLRAQVTGGKLTLREHRRAEWVEKDQVLRYELCEGDRRAVEAGILDEMGQKG